MAIEQKGPGGVSNSYGVRSTIERENYKTDTQYQDVYGGEGVGVTAKTNPVTGGSVFFVDGVGVSAGGGRLLVTPQGVGFGAKLQAAVDYVASVGGGYVDLVAGAEYVLDSQVVIDTSLVGLRGNRAVIGVSPALVGGVAITLTSLDGSGADRFPQVKPFCDVTIKGLYDTASPRDFNVTLVRCHSSVAGASVRVNLQNVRLSDARVGLSLGSRAYFVCGYGVEILRTKFALAQESGASDFAENVAFFGSRFYNSDCLLKDEGGQRWKFFGCSFDYHGDPTGGRITSDDAVFDLRNGAEVALHDCHIEFKYGDAAGQTLSPIRLAGANTKLLMVGGKIYNAGSQNPLWRALIQSDNNAQSIDLDHVGVVKLGRVGADTHDDCLVWNGDASHSSGGVARISARQIKAVGTEKNDLPSVLAYMSGASWYRNGVDSPHTELSSRITTTGSVAVASTGTTDGAVSARNAVGGMLKITGAGKTIISIPVAEGMRRHAWGLFFNASAAVGSITIKERHSTVNMSWDGASTITWKPDSRAAYGGATKTLVGGGANQWDRVSWKDCNSSANMIPRMNNAVFAIEIDTSAMTSGALYLDDVAFALM